MEQLIEAFGIDVRLIIIQVFNFGILMAVLTYFLYKPVLKMLNEREAKIAQGIKDAEEAAKVRGEATEEKKAILEKACIFEMSQKEILTRKGIDSVLATLTKIKFNNRF